MPLRMQRVAGIDGCRSGWLVVEAHTDLSKAELKFASNWHDVNSTARVIAVDMPIGLPERTGYGGRAAENAVRPLLGARQSAVFSVPSRGALAETEFSRTTLSMHFYDSVVVFEKGRHGRKFAPMMGITPDRPA